MDVFSPCFPTTTLPQFDQQCNDFDSKCNSKYSDVGDVSMSKTSEQQRNNDSSGIILNEYDDLNDLSKSSCANVSPSNSSPTWIMNSSKVDNPLKDIVKKCRHKKKGKSNNKCTDDVLKVVEVANQTFPACGTRTSETALTGTGFGHMVAVDCNARYSLSPCSMGLHCSNANTSLFSSPNEAISRSVEERNFSSAKDIKLDEYSYSPFGSEFAGKEPFQTSTASASHSGVMVECLKDAKGCASLLFSQFPSGENFNLVNNQTVKRSSTIDKGLISDHMETPSLGYVPHVNSRDVNQMLHFNNDLEMLVGAKKYKSSGSLGRTKYCNPNSGTNHGNAVIQGKTGTHERKLCRSSNDTALKIGHVKDHAKTDKENRYTVWQKAQKRVKDAPIVGSKHLVHNHVQMGIGTGNAAFLMRYRSFSKDRLLPTAVISSVKHNYVSEVTEIKNNRQGMYAKHDQLPAESPQLFPQQRFHGSNYKSLSKSSQNDNWRINLGEKSNTKPNHSVSTKQENLSHYKKGSWADKAPLYTARKKNLSQDESLEASRKTNFHSIGNDKFDSTLNPAYANAEVNMSQSRMAHPSDKVLLVEEPHTWMQFSRSEHASVGSSHSSSNNKEKSSRCFETERPYDDIVIKNSTSQVILQKWVPIGSKGTRMPKRNGGVDKPTSCILKSEIHEGDLSVTKGTFTFSSKNESFSSCEMPPVLRTESDIPKVDKLGSDELSCKDRSRKGRLPYDSDAMDTSQLTVCSQRAVKSLNEAYRWQIASESAQLMMGNPLAEFERLIYSVSPVIFPSYFLRHCEECSENPFFVNLLCIHQIPNIPLTAIWNWYEKPACFGLEVKVEDLENSKAIDSRGISFQAHFVPYLSAVQLFGYSCDSKCYMGEDFISKVPEEKREVEQTQDTLSVEEVEINPSKSGPVLVNLSKNPNSSNLLIPEGHELIFEFFESEQPQLRKPLYEKVMELSKAGTSCDNFFGDPSKLECLNLQDLHPTSWYSVAWYPIYRIPEGNLRASFLTYHSMGHLAQRSISASSSLDKRDFCIVSPVLGLQSYNTQGECWFYPNKPSHSFEGSVCLNTSEILKERLKTLEETALLFARGYVYKDNVEFVNRQPDYEFFLSRKH